MLIANWNGKRYRIIRESVGRVLVQIDDGQLWLIKGIPGLEIVDQPMGRPRKFNTDAEKQRAYRERKAGKALRKYQRQ